MDKDSLPSVEAAGGVVKGKRTKRRLRHVFVGAAVVLSSVDQASSSSVSDGSCASTTTEEEDMANCLILLAQGHAGGGAVASPNMQVAAAAATAGAAHAYECKTCSRRFPSFQALGGHRTSHKKPKLAGEEKTATADQRQQQEGGESTENYSVSEPNKLESITPPPAGKQRVHECSICGAEFTSGQALGGHMRRHRPLNTETAKEKEKNSGGGSGLMLDLNLPAPSDEETTGSLSKKSTGIVVASPELAGKNQQPRQLLLPSSSSSTLVDCHY